MRNKHIPIGIEIPDICQELIVSPMLGIYFDSKIPATIHNNTHKARNFSKKLIFFSEYPVFDTLSNF